MSTPKIKNTSKIYQRGQKYIHALSQNQIHTYTHALKNAQVLILTFKCTRPNTITHILILTFQHSMYSGLLPSLWKHANVALFQYI